MKRGGRDETRLGCSSEIALDLTDPAACTGVEERSTPDRSRESVPLNGSMRRLVRARVRKSERPPGSVGVRMMEFVVSIQHGQGGNRTPDTRIFSPLLYQLSYLASAPSFAPPARYHVAGSPSV